MNNLWSFKSVILTGWNDSCTSLQLPHMFPLHTPGPSLRRNRRAGSGYIPYLLPPFKSPHPKRFADSTTIWSTLLVETGTWWLVNSGVARFPLGVSGPSSSPWFGWVLCLNVVFWNVTGWQLQEVTVPMTGGGGGVNWAYFSIHINKRNWIYSCPVYTRCDCWLVTARCQDIYCHLSNLPQRCISAIGCLWINYTFYSITMV